LLLAKLTQDDHWIGSAPFNSSSERATLAEFESQFASLVDRRKPESQAFRAFIQRYLRMWRLESLYDVDDVLNEAYIRAMPIVRSGRSIKHVSAWVRATALNILRESFRRHSRDTLLLEDSLDRLTSNTADQLAEQEDFATKAEIVNLALQRLTVNDQRLLSLRYWKGLSWQAIAELLEKEDGIAPGLPTLRQRASRAVKNLKQQYDLLSGESDES
jgi:RNA polymerase sigma factor (sigma-70 family)